MAIVSSIVTGWKMHDDDSIFMNRWNAKSFATYYRTWNVVVHDWLYTYIYMEMMFDCLSVGLFVDS